MRSRWAARLLDEGRSTEARQQVDHAELAYARGTPDPRASYHIGLLTVRLGDPARAAAAFEQFLRLVSAGPQAEWARGWLAAAGRAAR